MKVFSKITDLRQDYPRPAIALGMFDGVHIGHQAIIGEACSLARESGGTSMVLTFSNHPLSALAPERMPLQIGDDAMKQKLVAGLGVDVLVDIPFTRDFARLSPEEFLALLRDRFAPRYVVTGPNYTFGCKGKGTKRMLLRVAEDYGFRAEVCNAVSYGSHMVSSTRIRKALADGDLDLANAMLGRSFAFAGRVRHGDRRGRTLGFPTANLDIPANRAMLPNGAYAVKAELGDDGGILCYGMASVGANPTFGSMERRVEVNLFDFADDIYDQRMQVSFCAHLREERRFSSAEQLVRQLRKDAAAARNFFQ